MRLAGHKLVVESNNERGEEHSATGVCICGLFEESGSSQAVVRSEYRHHLSKMMNQRNALWQKLSETG